jgi:putative addiction module killer protein
MIEVKAYLSPSGRNVFQEWALRLDGNANRKVLDRLERLAHGNLGDIKPVGGGVSELRIDFGPGYRIYLGFDGRAVVILLGGGTKRTQDRDIATARDRWADYKKRRKEKRE